MKKLKMANIILASLIITAALITTCSMFSPDGYGTLVVNVPGAARAAVTQEFAATLSYRVECGGVSGTFRAGVSASLSVPAGVWDVTITVLNAAGEGIGAQTERGVTITAGKATAVPLSVTIDPTGKRIAEFAITSPVYREGRIDEAAKTISVSVPDGTDVSGMDFSVTHTGRSISPTAPPLDFGSPRAFTVTAENDTTEVYTVTVTVEPPTADLCDICYQNPCICPDCECTVFTSIPDMQAYLEGQQTNTDDNPYSVKLNVAFTADTVWTDLYAALLAADRHVALDLSDSTGTTQAVEGDAGEGQQFIVSLVLPDSFDTVVVNDSDTASRFINYTELKSITGTITSIGHSAFMECASLTTADFQLVESIDFMAFYQCISLTTADFPLAESIGDMAFYQCTSLTTADIRSATDIGVSAFANCTSLTSITIAANATISTSGHGAATRFGAFRMLYEGNGKLSGVYTYTDGAWARTGDLP